MASMQKVIVDTHKSIKLMKLSVSVENHDLADAMQHIGAGPARKAQANARRMLHRGSETYATADIAGIWMPIWIPSELMMKLHGVCTRRDRANTGCPAVVEVSPRRSALCMTAQSRLERAKNPDSERFQDSRCKQDIHSTLLHDHVFPESWGH